MNRREMLKITGAAVASSAIAGIPIDALARDESVIRIEFTLFSAFYAPLIATIAGGFLQAEGLRPVYTVSAAGRSALASLDAGLADVVQTAPSQAFNALEKGMKPNALHFASVNQKDGFFLVAREPDSIFNWRKIKGKKILVTPGVQPTTMFKYACFKSGIDLSEIKIVDAGSPEAMVAAFRKGIGDYIHLQGPAPQQLEYDGVGHIVSALADIVGVCAFSSLGAKREWLATDQSKAFMRAYKKAHSWLLTEQASVVSNKIQPFFKQTHPSVLANTIHTYQKLGNWGGGVDITRPAFEATLDIFQHAGLIKQRYAYDDVVKIIS